MKQNRVPANLTGAFLLSATLAACGGAPSSVTPTTPVTSSPIGTPSGEAVRVAVGPEGGTVRSADGKLRLTIPAGALSASTEISVQPITRTTPNGVGGAYRLEPEGVTFKQDVQLTFAYDDAQESAASAFVIASQDRRGVWQAHLNTAQDREANTLTVSTNHFSDWSWAEAYKLDPQQAAVKVGQSVRLNLMRCVGPDTPFDEEDPVTPLITTCEPHTLTPFTRNWAVNGTAGGSAALGMVTKNEGDTSSGTYTAPAEKPSVNPVAVSVDLVRNETGKNTLRLVANVNVIGEGGPCKEVVPGLYTCKYRLTKWNGQDLPYTLPNDNPNSTATSRLTGGYLQLNTDEEGLVFGSGTYEIRYEYDHRPSGASQTMKQALNDVGNYLPRLATDDNTKFTSLGKVTYTGNITPEHAKVTNFPMSTETFSAPVTLEFVP